MLVVAGLGVWFYLAGRPAPAPEAPAETQIAPPKLQSAPPPVEAAPAHPLPEGGAAASLPELADSDVAFSSALAGLAGAAAVDKYLLPDRIIRRIVVTVDNLPRQKVAMDKRAVGPVPGGFAVSGDELHAIVAPQNAARYEPLVAILGKLDMHELARVYFHFYPLFQRAYVDLGYPDGYFNDRLVAVIDHLEAAPQPPEPIELVRPNVLYQYADPALEARSAGQKILMRMGAANAGVVKSKLRELRDVITASPPKRP